MKKTMLLTLLLFATFAYGQQQMRVAVMTTVDDADSIQYMELSFLTGKLREIASKVLPKDRYGIMTQESIVDRMGSQERAEKECREASCLAELGRKISASYIAQGRIGRFGGKLALKVELYNSKSGNLVGTFSETAQDLSALVTLLDNKAPGLFSEILKENKTASQPSVAGGISGLQSGTDDEFYVERRYLANFATEPPNAILSFNGMPAANCAKTPCSAEFAEGNVRIIAVLDQYETADTTVSIKQNNQTVNIRLKANFGVLEIKPAYSEGVARNENWSLAINGKAYSSWKNRLSPGKYGVKLSHRCYEDISFDVGINKNGLEVFDMSSYANLKKGGLTLSAEKNGNPVSEPVFINGRRAGETPFSGSVAVCSEIEIGSDREKVNVKLEHKQTIKYVHKIKTYKTFTDERDDNEYKMVTIGKQTWMAENLNYNASGSKCYSNNSANCAEYGRLYNWSTAQKICPSGWHLPNNAEWNALVTAADANNDNFVLVAKSDQGTDDFGFSALLGGYGSGILFVSFYNIGSNGYWWSADGKKLTCIKLGTAGKHNIQVSDLYSVRCVQNSGRGGSTTSTAISKKSQKSPVSNTTYIETATTGTATPKKARVKSSVSNTTNLEIAAKRWEDLSNANECLTNKVKKNANCATILQQWCQALYELHEPLPEFCD